MKIKYFAAILPISLVLIGAGCQVPARQSTLVQDNMPVAPVLTVDDEGLTTFNSSRLKQELAIIPKEEISDSEADGLIYMREEEKLAGDLYGHFADLWGTRSFGNIAKSEDTHTAAVLALIDKYQLPDPASGQQSGAFSNEHLQALFNDLSEQGNGSEILALKVGAVVEEVDIIDLQRYLEDVDNEDIRLVYENLMRGSRNHLRAYVRNLERQGVTYEPMYLTAEEFEEIISAPEERGDGGFGAGRNRGSGQRGNQ